MFDSADSDVQDLVAIGLFEGRDPAWLKRAKPFVGRRAAAWLKAYTTAGETVPPRTTRSSQKFLTGTMCEP
jgi:hypothetical protein